MVAQSPSRPADMTADGSHVVGHYWNQGRWKAFAWNKGTVARTRFTFHGDSAGDCLGSSVSGAGDVNGDGVEDLIVGARLADTNGEDSGCARVYSGKDGRVLYTFHGDAAGDEFGVSVSGAGDVNGDGFADVMVGAYLADHQGGDSGSVRVFSGADGSILRTFHGEARSQFGFSLSRVGDVNGDGCDDVVVGARIEVTTNGSSGTARVFSGATGEELFTFVGDSRGDEFGVSVSGAGDVNGDGRGDVIVGARRDDNNGGASGSARVFSGSNGEVLFTFNGDSREDRFGNSVSGAGDVNSDGFDDLIVGAPQDGDNGVKSGSARVFSGKTGEVLYTFLGDSAGNRFGTFVSGAADVNGDGFDDLIVGAPTDANNGTRSGSARVFSGRTGEELFTLIGESEYAEFGLRLCGVSDLNGDGFRRSDRRKCERRQRW